MRLNAVALASLVLLASVAGCSSPVGGRQPFVGYMLDVENHYPGDLLFRGWGPRQREPSYNEEMPPGDSFNPLGGDCSMGKKTEYLRVSTFTGWEHEPLRYAYWPAMNCGDVYEMRIDEAGAPHLYHCDPCKGDEPEVPPTESGVPGDIEDEIYWPPRPESST